MQILPRDWPVVFLSLDEPNADANHQHLLTQRPDALRVHGVLGSDRAHKAAAALVAAEWFFTVDADTRVDSRFWRQLFDVTALEPRSNTVFSFSSRNTVNGLCYGNGGIKLWQRQAVLAMQTHEISPGGDTATDFCWALDYVLMPGVWSQTLINDSSQQAWRAGFREGVKFTQIDGVACKDANQWQNRAAEVNVGRLCIWQQLGMDSRNGGWAILGARQGFYQALLTAWPTESVQDFTVLNQLWDATLQRVDTQTLRTEITELGRKILDTVSLDITADPPTADVSRWCKRMWPAAQRTEAKRLRS